MPELPHHDQQAVPARVGGVDLSFGPCTDPSVTIGPRPCGRGGFKLENSRLNSSSAIVPARVGGVDLSYPYLCICGGIRVPARVGGVDLSCSTVMYAGLSLVPARVGGVDLSRNVRM